jgi:hypothetical protein
VLLQPPESSQQQRKPSWLTQPAKASGLSPANSIGDTDAADNRIQRSRWRFDELQSAEEWNAEFENLPQATQLLSGSDGRPLVYRLTSDRWGDGQILIVANGAPFLNGSLVQPLHRAVGSKIIEACLPAKRVALLAYDANGILIASAADSDSNAAGLELLTVWPLSAITMPAALLGILICLALFPILGRPQGGSHGSVSDFGLHITALGRMLFGSRDLEYAKAVIGEYYRRVRDEPPPAWLESVQDRRARRHRQSPLARPAPTSAAPAKAAVDSPASTNAAQLSAATTTEDTKETKDKLHEKHERTI